VDPKVVPGTDPSPMPWRVLEDPVAPTPEPTPHGSRRPAVPRSALMAGGAAVLLAVAAFALAFGSGSSGAVTVVGGAPLGMTSPSANGSFDVALATSAPGLLVVEIVGAVDHPGVFRLAPGSRVGDLIAAAGGYGPRVDTDRAARDLNLAEPLHDGDQVRVPSRDDAAVPPPTPATGKATKPGGPAAAPVDLNHSTASELDALPGIGPVTAAKILASRDERPFETVDDLRTRKLVGEKAFEALKDLVTVR
jgi:competence protein ComEA